MVFPFPPSSPFISFLVSFFLLLFALETLDENGRDMWDDRYGVSGLGSRIRCDLNAREKEMEREGDGRHYLLFFFFDVAWVWLSFDPSTCCILYDWGCIRL
ncbi:hypothetical protein F4824DRAFT_467224 [Ustulina deusta]|nr:hypothetical protein F4824DRAFT_467224 [Ustulina deusta]